jgi:polyhydroxyalkanoate synthesis regulator phasin
LIREIQEMTEYQNSLTPYTAIMADIQHCKDKISKLERQVELLEDAMVIYRVNNAADRGPPHKGDK